MPSSARSRIPGDLRCYHDGEMVGRDPRGVPHRRGAALPRRALAPRGRAGADASRGPYVANALLELLASPNIRSRGWIYERYDHLVGSRTVRRPGLDAAVLRLRPSLRGLARRAGGPAGPRARPADRRGARRARGGAERRLRRRRAARADRLPQLRQPGEAARSPGSSPRRSRGWRWRRGALRFRSSPERLALQRDRRPRDPPAPVVGCVGLVPTCVSPGRWREGDASCWRGRPISLAGSEYQALYGEAGGARPRLDLARRAGAGRVPLAGGSGPVARARRIRRAASRSPSPRRRCGAASEPRSTCRRRARLVRRGRRPGGGRVRARRRSRGSSGNAARELGEVGGDRCSRSPLDELGKA